MAAKVRRETELEMMWKRLGEGKLREKETVEDLNKNCEALNPSKLRMLCFALFFGFCFLWWAGRKARPVQVRTARKADLLDHGKNVDVLLEKKTEVSVQYE